MKPIDMILILVLIAVVYFVGRRYLKTRSQGGCAGCSMSGSCPSAKKLKNQS